MRRAKATDERPSKCSSRSTARSRATLRWFTARGGGVFIAGGIAQKMEEALIASAFRAQFERKGRMSDYVRAIPTRLILSEDTRFHRRGECQPGIAGAAP